MSGEGTKTETPGHRVISAEQKECIAWFRQNEANVKAFLNDLAETLPETDPLSGEKPRRNIARAITACEDCAALAVRAITGGPILPPPTKEPKQVEGGE